MAAHPVGELEHLLVAPHPRREAREYIAMPRAGRLVANIIIDPRGIGPVGLDRDNVETVALDQPARDRGAGAVEFGSPVSRLTEQHDLGVAETIEHRTERRGVRRMRQRLGRLAQRVHQPGGCLPAFLIKVDVAHGTSFLARPQSLRRHRSSAGDCSEGSAVSSGSALGKVTESVALIPDATPAPRLREPWNSPQSIRTRRSPALSSVQEPVTAPAAPWKVSSSDIAAFPNLPAARAGRLLALPDADAQPAVR